MARVHAFARHQLHLAGVKLKRRYDHWSQASEYSLGMKIWFFNPWRRKGKCPKLTLPWQGPGVILAQISYMGIKIKMGPWAFPRIVHADCLRPYKGDEMPSWIDLTEGSEARLSIPVDAKDSLELE